MAAKIKVLTAKFAKAFRKGRKGTQKRNEEQNKD